MTIASTAWRYTKAMPGFIFGTQSELMGETLKKSYKAQGWKKMGTQIADAFEKGVTTHETAVTKNGGFFKNMWKDLTSIFPDTKNKWKAAGRLADIQKKNAAGKFWKQFKSLGKVFGKRMPLIGAALTLAFELPNIIKTSWNEGLLAGGWETAKTGVRLGTGAVGGAIGSALIPIPFVGAMVGYAVGDMVGRFIVGKSYSEKKEAAAEEQKTAQAQFNNNIDTSKIPFGGIGAVNDEEFQKLQNEYLKATGQNSFDYSSNTSNPFNPQPNFSTLG